MYTGYKLDECIVVFGFGLSFLLFLNVYVEDLLILICSIFVFIFYAWRFNNYN